MPRSLAPTLVVALSAAAWGGCVGSDDGLNPPPERLVTEPSPGSPGPRAVAIDLLDTLDRAEVSRPLEGTLLPGSRTYPHPWGRSPHDQRVVWKTGERNRWNLRAGLVLPAPNAVTWPVRVPAGGRLTLDVAAAGEGALSWRVTIGGEVLSRGAVDAAPVDEPRAVRPVEVDLTPWAGTSVRLQIAVDGAGATALLLNPVITAPAPRADNLLLIIVDAQRADTLSPARTTLPPLFDTMERLVAEGTAFRRAFAAGNQTRLSTFALLSGQPAGLGGFHQSEWDFTGEDKARYYAGDPPLLGRRLHQAGYRTVAVGNNAFWFGYLDIGLDAGFDEVIDHRHRVQDTPWMTDSAIEWIRRHQGERWAMVLNYNAPHWCYEPPDRSWERFLPRVRAVESHHRAYLGEIQWVDEHLRRVLAALDGLGLAERTLVVLTSDHGEIMDPRHDCFNETIGQECIHNHGMTLFDEELHVPLVLRQPGRIPAGQVIETPVSLLDLAPTLLSLLGVAPAPRQIGRDLSRAVLTGAPMDEAPVLAHGRFSTALRWRGFKYVTHDPLMQVTFHQGGLYDPSRGHEELYDLRADPHELHNLAPDGAPSLLKGLRLALATHRRSLNGAEPEGPPQNVLQLRGPARLTGRITVAGALVTGGSTHEVALSPGETLRFQTEPPDAPLTLALSLDGRPVRPDEVLVGRYALPLLEGLHLDAEALARAHAAEPPVAATVGPPTVLFWREGGRSPAARAPEPGLEHEVRELMKAWGYTGR